MNLHILKTDLIDLEKLEEIQPFLNQHPSIIRWNVDIEDIDKVLKVESLPNLSETNLIEILNTQGVHCEILPD